MRWRVSPSCRLDERHVWKSIQRIAHIRELCVSHQDFVRLAFLLGQKGNRLSEYRAAPASRNTNDEVRWCISTLPGDILLSGAQRRLAFHVSFRRRA